MVSTLVVEPSFLKRCADGYAADPEMENLLALAASSDATFRVEVRHGLSLLYRVAGEASPLQLVVPNVSGLR